eukprot:CAMPEP_0170546444 /NCGR_PEP_ID=MMETSP0211-20121228/4796_1 /TAXON_ID=311385 /ORGANISM="Pseudokeronopsis sp., Strain OXSARD2" /LENGTH=75 /DNA_ID=CAMNT_0010850919 /DNA_START=1518 /DNA_END=1745 /DNA_ORIENTATION=-
MSSEQKLASLLGGDLATSAPDKNKAKALQINQIGNITQNQVQEIESKLRQEQEQKQEIINNGYSGRTTSTPPESK